MANNEGKLIGKVIHYFSNVEVAVLKIKSALKVGDKIKFKKGDNEFDQKVSSIQIDHKKIIAGKKGDEIAVKSKKRVKEGWEVYKL